MSGMTAPSRLRALAQAATPGPWRWGTEGMHGPILIVPATEPAQEGAELALVYRFDDAIITALAPDLAVWAADAAEALQRARDTAQIVANGCDTGHLDFTVEDADALLARLDEITGGKE